MPTMPGTGLVMIKTEFVFGRLETFFDPPARAFNVHEFLHGCPFRAPGRKIGKVSIGDISTDQEATCPRSCYRAVKFFSIQIGKRKIRPVVYATSLAEIVSSLSWLSKPSRTCAVLPRSLVWNGVYPRGEKKVDTSLIRRSLNGHFQKT